MSLEKYKESKKCIDGELARKAWCKFLKREIVTISKLNKECGDVFKKGCKIVLDDSERRQTTLKTIILEH